jgi:hypothetical protein
MGIGEKNVGTTDRIVRAIAGLALLYGYYIGYLASPWSYVLLLLAAIMLATAALGSCCLYTLLGMGTMGKKGKKKK